MNRNKVVRIVEEDFDKPLFVANFSPFLSLFKGKYNDIVLSERLFSKICYQIQYFMEIHLGKDSKSSANITKLPARLFRNFETSSAMNIILSESLRFMEKYEMKEFDILSSGSKDTGLQLLMDLTNALIQSKDLLNPVIYFDKISLDVISNLSNIVIKHGGTVTDNILQASHIIEWNDEIDNSGDITDEYVRTVDVRADGATLIHFYYYPDSYDLWLSPEELGSESVEGLNLSKPPIKKWRLACKFIKDSEIFNEWGNELDYEIDDLDSNETASSTEKSSPLKRLKSSRKLSIKESSVPEAVLATENVLSEIGPPLLPEPQAVYNVLPEGQTSHLSVKSEKRKLVEESDVSSIKSKIQKLQGNISALKLPEWFSINTISPLEIRYLPESLTKVEYLRIRTDIITIYSQNPSLYLSATECRQKILGDVGFIISVHELLDAFDIINHSVVSEFRPALNMTIFGANEPSPSPQLQAPEEVNIDNALVSLVSEIGLDWSKISSILKTKGYDIPPIQCLQRFAKISARVSEIGQVSDKSLEKIYTRIANEELNLQIQVSEYLQTRFSALEDKVDVLDDIQIIFQEERERLEIERRDLLIQKAQLSYGVAQLPK